MTREHTTNSPAKADQVVALKPKKFSQPEMEWNNRITLCSSTLHYQFGNTPFEFKIQPKNNTRPSQHMHCIKLKAGKHFFWITINQWPTSYISGHSDFFPLIHSTSKNVRNMTVEVILTPVLNWVEKATGLSITVHDYFVSSPNLKEYLSFSFYYDDANDLCMGQLSLSEALKMPFYSLLDRWTTRQEKTFDSLRLPTKLVIGSTAITIIELNTIEIGDVILMDQNIYSEGNRMWAHFPPSTLITLKKEPQAVADSKSNNNENHLPEVVVEAVTESQVPNQSPTDNSGNQTRANNSPIDKLEVQLDFDIGSVSLPLSQIKQLKPGYIFSVDRPLDRSVYISCNGQRLAGGELVDINGSIGVRVKKIFKKSNG